MTQDAILDILTDTLFTIILVSAPPLLMGLIVGVTVSIFQTVTSIQEQTLGFIPKILAVLLSIIIFGPFMITTLTDYYFRIMDSIQIYIVPR